MAELRDEAKRYYVENDRLRRALDSLKMEIMNANVDKNTWKEKFEANSREVDRLKDLLNTLRRKHSALSRPSTQSIASDEIVKMCAKPSDVPNTPAPSGRLAPSSFALTSTAKQPHLPALTPATGAAKRPLQETRGEKRLEEMSAMENSARAAELSLNSSVRRRPPPKRQKIKFLPTNMVKSEVQAVGRIDGMNGEKKDEKVEETNGEGGVRDALQQDENDEKEKSLYDDDKTLEEKKDGEEERMDEGRENHDPSFIMSKERMPADANLEATVLDETTMLN